MSWLQITLRVVLSLIGVVVAGVALYFLAVTVAVVLSAIVVGVIMFGCIGGLFQAGRYL